MVHRESYNSPELNRLACLSFLIALSSGKGEHVGVIPQVGRMEVSKAVNGNSLSRPCVVNEHAAQFGISPQADHEASSQSCPVANEIRLDTERFSKNERSDMSSFIQ